MEPNIINKTRTQTPVILSDITEIIAFVVESGSLFLSFITLIMSPPIFVGKNIL